MFLTPTLTEVLSTLSPVHISHGLGTLKSSLSLLSTVENRVSARQSTDGHMHRNLVITLDLSSSKP